MTIANIFRGRGCGHGMGWSEFNAFKDPLRWAFNKFNKKLFFFKQIFPVVCYLCKIIALCGDLSLCSWGFYFCQKNIVIMRPTENVQNLENSFLKNL